MAVKRLSDLSQRQRQMLGLAGFVQVSLLAAALIDIRRRPEDQIKGPKWLWAGISFINFIGPAAYFTIGRKRGGETAGKS